MCFLAFSRRGRGPPTSSGARSATWAKDRPHAGPVIFQEGDYYGQTVNLASRIADYAQAGEVIVSQAVVHASAGSPVVFRAVGPVELKGVAGAMLLYAAS